MFKLKYLFTGLILLITVNAFSQFELPSSIGFGLKVNQKFEYELFQSTVNVTPQFQIQKFKLGAGLMTVINDSLTQLFTGPKVSYEIWSNPAKEQSLEVSGHTLFGFEGRRLYGGGLIFTDDRLIFSLDGSMEYLKKEGWFTASIGWLLVDAERNDFGRGGAR